MREKVSPPVAFAFRSAELTAEARSIMSDWARKIATSSDIFWVIGWCDPIGEHPGARPLAKVRAGAVYAELVALGAPPSRLRTGVQTSLTDGSRVTLERSADGEG